MVTLKHRYWNGRAIGSSVQFFIDRWEKTKNKPRFYVNAPVEPQGDVEIQVKVEKQIFLGHKARFYVVSIGNSGANTAEKVKAAIYAPQIWKSVYRLIPISPAERPFFTVDWLRPSEEFGFDQNSVARAFVLDAIEREEQIDLYGGGFAVNFTLLFTMEGSRAIFFPTEATLAVDIPDVPFHLNLMVQAKDMPTETVAVFKVERHDDWDKVKVTPLSASEQLAVLKSRQLPK